MALALSLEQVRLTTLIAGLDLALEAGDRVALLGPNGVGKSTVLSMAAGLVLPSAGRVSRQGVCGYAPQRCGDTLLPWKTSRDNVALAGLAVGLSPAAIAARVDEVLALLPSARRLMPRLAHHLSPGEQQQVALCRALFSRPSLLLLDEPFSALDVVARQEAIDGVGRFVETRGAALLLASHRLDEAFALTRRYVVLAGRPASVAAAGDIAATDAPTLLAMLSSRSETS